MAKPEWGTKRTCPKCSTRFYDLGRDNPVVCINCENEWVPEPILKSKQPILPAAGAPPAAKSEPAEATEEAEGEDLNLEEESSEGEGVLGDVSLDDDDSDVSGVIDSSGEDET